jgi:hypothetical protein
MEELTFEAAYIKICELVEDFDRRHGDIKDAGYKEDSAKHEFITPFFEYLGWDVRNRDRKSVYEKAVVTEKRENISGSAKSADYAFRRPGTHITAFFAEAKKPSVNLNHHTECYQAVLYGWNAGTPLVILTNFEEFLILDARIRPDKENAIRSILREHGRYTYRDYRDKEKFSEIWGLFARVNVAAGSIDRAAAALPKLSGKIHKDDLFARGSRAVDLEFLSQMELWREKLAKVIKQRNPKYDGAHLTSLTQRILDRLVFFRFLEDRGIEKELNFDQFGKGGSVWSDFLRISRRLDARYNGIIYKEDRRGCEDPDLGMDDAAFANILENLDPRNSDYLFSQIPVTILGSIYERFLGNVIVAEGSTASVEPKPDVRKAGGVYYTPDYIVRFIVRETVEVKLRGKTPKQIEKLKFADISCGSGSFLVEVFDSLLRYHLQWYRNDGDDKWEKRGMIWRREIDEDFVLTLVEKRRILLANIFGVDLDEQAIEVTQLSLYLKLMEDESFPSTQSLFDFEKHALLPNLKDNIKCGNSLVASNFSAIFEDNLRVRSFDWDVQFHHIHKDGGFDVILGNPPYGAAIDAQTAAYLKSNFQNSGGESDTYAIFMEQALRLVRPEGLVSMIVPTGWYSGANFSELRQHIAKCSDPKVFVNLPYDIFDEAWVDTTVFIIERRVSPVPFPRTAKHEMNICTFPKRHRILNADEFYAHYQPANFADWFRSGNNIFLTYSDQASAQIITQMEKNGVPLARYADIQRGVTPFKLTDKPEHENSRPAFNGNIRRYCYIQGDTKYLRYDDSLAEYKPEKYFKGPRILLRELISRQFTLQAAIVSSDFVTNKSMQSILPLEGGPDLHFLLGILNSRLLSWYFLQKSNIAQRDDFPKIVLKETRNLPFPRLLKNSECNKAYGEIATMSKQVQGYTSKLPTVKTAAEQQTLWNGIKKCEQSIDQLVYKLFDLTEAQIEVVEAADKPAKENVPATLLSE